LQVGTKWTGGFWEGYFQSPLSITSGFAEMWLLEYLNDIPNFAFGALSLEEIRDIYQVHVEMMSLGTDPWKVISTRTRPHKNVCLAPLKDSLSFFSL
jgi:hypothetical protein